MPEVQAAKESLQLAETEAKRAKLLYEGGSAPQALADQAKARAETARAQYEAALNGAKTAWAALKMARAAEDLSEKASNDTDVRAPFAGVVAERRITAGEYAMPGRVVAVLVKTDRLRLKVDVPESESAKVQPGGEVLLTVAAWPGRVFQGKVARVGAALKPMSRALPIEAEIDNPDGALKPGFFAHVQLVLPGEAESALLVPPTAIGTSGSATRVFVIEGGSAIEHVVAVGRHWQDLVEVRGTLPKSAKVAVDHLDELTDGARVARDGTAK
jgi:RND family efflux transporter MFP subunit